MKYSVSASSRPAQLRGVIPSWPRKIDDNLLSFLGLVTGLRVALCDSTHGDPLQTRRHRGVIRAPLFAAVVACALRILVHSQTTHSLGRHEGTAMCDEKEHRRSWGTRREGEGGEGAAAHTGGYFRRHSATREEIPRSYCPFGQNGSGTRCLPLILERCVEHSLEKPTGSSAKTRTLDLARTRSGSCN